TSLTRVPDKKLSGMGYLRRPIGSAELPAEGGEERSRFEQVVDEVQVRTDQWEAAGDASTFREESGGAGKSGLQVDVHDVDVLRLVPDGERKREQQPPVPGELRHEQNDSEQHPTVPPEMDPFD